MVSNTETARNKKIRIVVADDHGVLRDGLKVLLKKQDNMEVVGEAHSGDIALGLVEKLKPDVVLMDIKMPKMSGIEASQQIKQRSPDTKILILTADLSNHMIGEAINSGVLGLMLKESVFDELACAINSVYENEQYLCPRVRSLAATSYVSWLKTGCHPDSPELTDDDRELIVLLSQGKSVGEIALYLDRSPKTIDARRRKTMDKLGISNMVELTKFAIRQGLTSVET